MNEKVDIVSWSLCGDQTAILNVNSEIRISPQTSRDKGLMTVGSTGCLMHLSSRSVQTRASLRKNHSMQRFVLAEFVLTESPFTGRLLRWAAAHAVRSQLAFLLSSLEAAPKETRGPDGVGLESVLWFANLAGIEKRASSGDVMALDFCVRVGPFPVFEAGEHVAHDRVESVPSMQLENTILLLSEKQNLHVVGLEPILE